MVMPIKEKERVEFEPYCAAIEKVLGDNNNVCHYLGLIPKGRISPGYLSLTKDGDSFAMAAKCDKSEEGYCTHRLLTSDGRIIALPKRDNSMIYHIDHEVAQTIIAGAFGLGAVSDGAHVDAATVSNIMSEYNNIIRGGVDTDDPTLLVSKKQMFESRATSLRAKLNEEEGHFMWRFTKAYDKGVSCLPPPATLKESLCVADLKVKIAEGLLYLLRHPRVETTTTGDGECWVSDCFGVSYAASSSLTYTHRSSDELNSYATSFCANRCKF